MFMRAVAMQDVTAFFIQPTVLPSRLMPQLMSFGNFSTSRMVFTTNFRLNIRKDRRIELYIH